MFVEGTRCKGCELAQHCTDEQRDLTRLRTEPVHERITQVMRVGGGQAAEVLSGLAESRGKRFIGFRQSGIRYALKPCNIVHAKLFHQGFGQFLRLALRIAEHADDPAHDISLGIESVCCR